VTKAIRLGKNLASQDLLKIAIDTLESKNLDDVVEFKDNLHSYVFPAD